MTASTFIFFDEEAVMKVIQKILEQTKHNRKSGIVVAIVSIPLSLSLAIASWATPLQGIISAIWAMLLAAMFASNRFNIFGPAGALSGILLWFVLIYGGAYLPYIAIFSGILMLVAYGTKIIKYLTLIPAAGLEWFLFAVGLTILISQLPNALGIVVPVHDKIYLNIQEIFLHITQIQWAPFITALIGIAIILILKKKTPKIPGAIVVSLVGIGLGFLIKQGIFPDMPLLIDKYPSLNFALRDWSYITSFKQLFTNSQIFFAVIKTSLVVAIITVLETIISWKAAEKMTKKWFSKDKEILWNAIANIWSWIMGGLPVTAVFVRTSLNIKSWATSKRSQAIAAISVLIICFLMFNNLFVMLPMSIIAAILISIAIGILDISVFKHFYGFKKTSFYIVMITILVSVFVDTIIGIAVGTIIALLVFIKRTSNEEINVVVFRNKKFISKSTLSKYINHQHSDDTLVVKFSGQINYLNSDNYYQQLRKIHESKQIIFSFSQASDVDMDGLKSLETVFERFLQKGVDIYLTGIGTEWTNKLSAHLPVVDTLLRDKKVYSSTSELLDNLRK